MMKHLFVLALLICASVISATELAKQAPKRAVKLAHPEGASKETCVLCYDALYEALEVWVEMVGYAGIFMSCTDFCFNIAKVGGMACVAICDFLGNDEFYKLLGELQLDPVYACQILNACPKANCSNDSCDTAAITSGLSDPKVLTIPNVDNNYTVYFTIKYNITTPFKGTGSIYWQVENDGNFMGNGGQLLIGVTEGPHTATWGMQFNECMDSNVPVGGMTTLVYICEGECTQYGQPNHPYTKLMALYPIKWKVANNCP